MNGFPYRRLARLLLIIGVIAIAVVSLVPSATLPRTGIGDKWAHFVAYGALAATAALGFSRAWSLIVVLVGLGAMGVVLEGAQSLVPGRVTEIADAVANLGGVLFVFTLWWLVRQRSLFTSGRQ